MSYFKNKIFIIIFLLLISLIGIIVSNFNLEAYEIPNGYGKVKFGMSKEQIKQILRDEGSVITGETNKIIQTTGELFGEKVNILYSFTPITQKCMNIAIYFSPSDRQSLQKRITNALIEKYGKPYPTYVDGQSLPLWENWGNISMGLLDQRDNLLLFYVDKNLVDIGKEEQNKLDKESKNKL